VFCTRVVPILVLEREWRRPDGTKPAGLLTVQGRGRKRAARRRVYIFRPAYIYPVEPRKEPNLSYRLLPVIYPAFRVLFPNQVIPADDLGHAMVDVAVRETGKPGGRILEICGIRAMVKSLPPSNKGIQ
jgi:hypothetical protein